MFPYARPAPPLPCRAQTAQYLQVRRPTEIQDGLRMLASYVTSGTWAAALQQARRHTPDDDQARELAAAACLRLARTAKLREEQPLGNEHERCLRPMAASTERDAAGLERLARAYRSRAARSLAEQVDACRPAMEDAA